MTLDATSSATQGPTMCQRHPDVETGLACGRCETPICPRCLVYTPAGTRCPTCATIGRPKMYTLGALDYVRAISTAVVVGLALGFVAALLLAPTPRIGLFSIILAVAGGYGLGVAMAEALNLTTSRKRGRQMQMVAAGGIVLAAITRLVLSGVPLEWALRDFAGLMMVAIAISTASSRRR
ncbi:MAG: B-box zinc finger protein [Chloroflexi bacterium]|nr:B-box zinc finger protein [Chloroflexota bacterium]